MELDYRFVTATLHRRTGTLVGASAEMGYNICRTSEQALSLVPQVAVALIASMKAAGDPLPET